MYSLLSFYNEHVLKNDVLSCFKSLTVDIYFSESVVFSLLGFFQKTQERKYIIV